MVVSVTQEGRITNILQSGQAKSFSGYISCDRNAGSVPPTGGDFRDVRTLEEPWTTSSTMSSRRVLESGICTLCILIMPDGIYGNYHSKVRQ